MGEVKNYSNLTSSNPTQSKWIPIKQNLYKVQIFPGCDVEMAAFSIQRLSDIIRPAALPAIWATEKHRLHTLCSRITLICDVKVSKLHNTYYKSNWTRIAKIHPHNYVNVTCKINIYHSTVLYSLFV